MFNVACARESLPNFVHERAHKATLGMLGDTAKTREEGDPRSMGCVYYLFQYLWLFGSQSSLSYWQESSLVSHEGTLVDASLICTENEGNCLYYIKEHFEYANFTRYCTVTSLDSFPDRYYAEIALSKDC